VLEMPRVVAGRHRILLQNYLFDTERTQSDASLLVQKLRSGIPENLQELTLPRRFTDLRCEVEPMRWRLVLVSIPIVWTILIGIISFNHIKVEILTDAPNLKFLPLHVLLLTLIWVGLGFIYTLHLVMASIKTDASQKRVKGRAKRGSRYAGHPANTGH
jgi:hypothetical protein